MKLIEPTMEYCPQIRAYRKEFLENGDSMDGTGGLRQIEDPAEWVERSISWKDAANVPEGRVAATQLIYVREEDEKIVGMLQIRHTLNDYLRQFGGHIGYSVAPSERRKGYASRMLRTALPICKELGLDRVLITCNDYNEASRRTILSNGGRFESTAFEPEENETLERYWIDI